MPNTRQPKLPRILLTLNFFLLCALALLSTTLIALYLPAADDRQRPVTLPDLVGTSLADHASRLPAELYDISIEYRPDPATAPGTILAQSPQPGAVRRVIPGQAPCHVRLTVSTGPARTTLAGLVGKNARETALTLQAAGLVVRQVTALRQDMEPGLIISVSPPEGTELAEGQTVTLTVSAAPTPRTVTVPDTVGSPLVAANTALVLRGLVPGEVFYEASNTAPDGIVVAQRPLAGTLVPAGTEVILTVGVGGDS